MANEIRTILVAGSAGRIGSLLVSELRQRKDVRIRVLNRRAVDHGPGVESVQGSAADRTVADAAVKGVDAVISTMNGGAEVLIEGQLNLLDAAARHGVRRFIPSDYSGDYFRLDKGDNVFLEMHKHVAEKVLQSSVGHSFVMTGGFMEVALAPHMGAFDFQNGTATLWGSGNEQLNLTAQADVAKLICAVVFDEKAHNQKVEFVGEVTSYRGIARDYEAITGRQMKVVSRGDVDTLRRWIEERKATAKSPLEYVFAQYQLGTVSGKTILRGPFWNDRYPHIQATSVRQVLARVLDDLQNQAAKSTEGAAQQAARQSTRS